MTFWQGLNLYPFTFFRDRYRFFDSCSFLSHEILTLGRIRQVEQYYEPQSSRRASLQRHTDIRARTYNTHDRCVRSNDVRRTSHLTTYYCQSSIERYSDGSQTCLDMWYTKPWLGRQDDRNYMWVFDNHTWLIYFASQPALSSIQRSIQLDNIQCVCKPLKSKEGSTLSRAGLVWTCWVERAAGGFRVIDSAGYHSREVPD